ncbi:MAG: hypothetical protein AB7U39_21590, partial [Ilumatobacteraceae bacterium]
MGGRTGIVSRTRRPVVALLVATIATSAQLVPVASATVRAEVPLLYHNLGAPPIPCNVAYAPNEHGLFPGETDPYFDPPVQLPTIDPPGCLYPSH